MVSTSDHNLNDQGDQASKPEISEKKVEKKSSWMPNWWKGNNGTEGASSTKNEETTTLPGTENVRHFILSLQVTASYRITR